MHENMKEKALNNKKEAVIKTAPSDTLQSKVAAAAKSVENALESYKKKDAAWEHAWKEQGDKMELKRLLAAAKIAKFTYKIKVIEHKLAKANLKAANKASKKTVKEASKGTSKFKAIITTEDQLKSTESNEKSSVKALKIKQAPKDKKKTAVKE